jgi:hypothetical protein
MGFSKQEKPMSTSSTITDSSARSDNHMVIRVGLIGVGNGLADPRSASLA